MKRNRIVTGSLLSMFLAALLQGEDLDVSVDAAFLQTLNEASELAMHDKLNIDDIPSTVTVVRRQTIVQSGAKTLLDILRLVPGIGVSMSASGKRQIVMRGVRSKYRDKIKLLINGIDVTNNLYSNQFYYYDFPASLIQRVEVTKTPDAILYGSNAFLGVINVITLDEDSASQLHVTKTSRSRSLASLFQTVKVGEGVINFDAHYSRFDPYILAPADYRNTRKAHISTLFREPLPAYTKERTTGVGVQGKWGEWQFDYRYQQYEKGNFFGITNLTPLRDDQGVTMTHQAGRLSYETYLTPELKWHAHVDYKDYVWDGSYRTVPIDYAAPTPSNDPDNDVIMGAYIHEIETGAVTYLRYNDFRHNATIQLEGHYAKPKDMYYIQYVPAMGSVVNEINLGPYGEPLRGEHNILKEGIDRRVLAVAAEDLYTLSDRVALVGGLRYDHYNDFDGHLSYKMGAIYKAGRGNTFKLLFNHTFRAPSWVELYSTAATEIRGNEELEPETMDMVELDWLHRFAANDLLKLNLYYGRNKNPIVRGVTQYINGKTMDLRGGELSYRRSFAREGEWTTSASYAYVDNPSCAATENDVIRLKSWILYPLAPNLRGYAKVEYRDRAESTGRDTEPVDAWVTVDATLTYRCGRLRLQGGVTNLFDQKVAYAVTPSEPIGGKYVFVPEDRAIPSLGREWFVRAEWRW